MYTYIATIKKVYDGDTIIVDIDLGFNIYLYKQIVRLHGIDTPEIRTKNLLEKEAGLKVRDYIRKLMPVDSKVVLHSRSVKGKFGRILGDFELLNLPPCWAGNVKLLSEHLYHKKLGFSYFGGTKVPFTDFFLENIISSI
jgi:micrococcal nuclease